MRRNCTADTTDLPLATGAGPTGFTTAYRSLVEAFLRHDDLRGDPARVHELSRARQELDVARRDMLYMRTHASR